MGNVDIEMKDDKSPTETTTTETSTTNNNNNNNLDEEMNVTETTETETPTSTSPTTSSPPTSSSNTHTPSIGGGSGGGITNEEDDEEEDYIVTEVPVYLSQTLADNLFLFQYPLRQPWRPYDMNRLEELRIKPKQQKVEIDLSIDIESDNFNDQSDIKTEKNTLSSTSVAHRTNYAVGILRNDEFHLTPLQSIIQLRPHFNVVDEKYEEEKKEKKREILESGEVDEDEDDKPQQVSYRKPNAKQVAANQPLNAIKKMEDEEKWIKLTLVDDRLDINLDEQFNKLIAPVQDNIHFDLNPMQYLDLLCPKIPEEWVPKESHAQETTSLEAIHQMPWQKQIRHILMNGNVLPFSKIYQLLSDHSIPDYEVAAELENIAYLLKGRWVIKRKEFAEKTLLSSDFARDMLAKIANVDLVSRRWYLKQHEDEEFLTRFPILAEKQTKLLRDQYDSVIQSLENLSDPSSNPIFDIISRGIGKEQLGQPSKTVTATGGKDKQQAGEANAAPQQVIPEDFTVGTTIEQQLLFFIINLLKNHGVCSNLFIKQSISQQSDNQMANNLLRDLTDDTLVTSTLNLVCDRAHHAYVLKSSGNPSMDKYRRVVIDLFKKKMILKKSDVTDACLKILGEDIPAGMKTTIMHEFAYQKGTAWVFKAGK
ncbi:RNA polymerase III subunit [Heterostelium album PN500]|uniref:RNA polymerase III subunit n=1 Tax=Heterostelium pallidum (strain ATCC 26659 / Pp 5 / PN500) TaxID=670386 RepID=D3BUH3_HETP5|nr:RNA polymerase III subunit [Heterostelium album PN500]EFA74761.1 RNA polymerase III subunit [Heterostelium album PN500]|eukprot:XP_020426895.1 RNA polymerase III subunit [Heterostelium album PN500]